MTNLPHNLCTGEQGEEWASNFLRAKGYHILNRNWRFRQLELDIVALDADTIVFVEVKTRTTENYGTPSLAVTRKKQKNITKAAQAWLAVNNKWDAPCRFDIVGLVGHSPTFSVEHICHAFELPPAMGRRNTHWQPW